MALLLFALILFASILILALLLTALPRLGAPGRWLSNAFSRPPLLDIALAALTIGPWVAGAVRAGWLGLLIAVAAQMAAVYAWIFIHEALHAAACRGPRIVRFTNRIVGTPQNHLALWLTTFGVPVLWLVRLLEIFVYPTLIWLLRFPRYDHAEWVSLSRHRFRDLVGHDLVWCLYCDWMTGTWSLGTEMLRNVESFWCPIRFDHPKKLEHTAEYFPDIERGWVAADGTMAQVEKVLEEKYGGPPGTRDRAWFNHPARPEVAEHRTLMPEVEQREILLEHSQHPRNCGRLADATHSAEGELPFCNDRVSVQVRLVEGKIAEAAFAGAACPICTASASLMTSKVAGLEIEEARRLFAAFHAALVEEGPADSLGDLAALTGVSKFPTRVKCATLPWHTLLAALDKGA